MVRRLLRPVGKYFCRSVVTAVIIVVGLLLNAGEVRPQPVQLDPLLSVVDLDQGEIRHAVLHDGQSVEVEVTDVRETRGAVMGAITSVAVDVRVNGETITIGCGNYNRPQPVDPVQVDCPVTLNYMEDSQADYWGLEKDVRLRLWPVESPLVRPGTFVYPVKQRWFAASTWMANEPVSERPNDKIYYHGGLDIGATEGLAEVVAAARGQIVAAGENVLPAHRETLGVKQFMGPRYDVVYLRDRRGWYYRYSHLDAIEVEAGQWVEPGDRIGYVGKEGGSGGWSHLHFEIKSRFPSGNWGTQEGYAFLMEAYQRQYDPSVLAVARPHHRVYAGAEVTLDASRSWAKRSIEDVQWMLSDGSNPTGMTVQRTYKRPGTYSEIVKVVDAQGNYDYDFATVRVHNPETGASGPGVDANYHPTSGIHPGDPVVFTARGRGVAGGEDIYDFGDGSDTVRVPSNIDTDQHAELGYGSVVHQFDQPGDYIVTVKRRNEETGLQGVQHLHVKVLPEEPSDR